MKNPKIKFKDLEFNQVYKICQSSDDKYWHNLVFVIDSRDSKEIIITPLKVPENNSAVRPFVRYSIGSKSMLSEFSSTWYRGIGTKEENPEYFL